jgi:hypothetical protein
VKPVDVQASIFLFCADHRAPRKVNSRSLVLHNTVVLTKFFPFYNNDLPIIKHYEVHPVSAIRFRRFGSLAGSEAVLPAYLIGMVLAGTVGKDLSLIRRLRTLTFGFLTPFYFIRAGSFVSVPALLASPVVLLVLFSAKMLTKIVAVFPAVRFHKYEGAAGFVTRS